MALPGNPRLSALWITDPSEAAAQVRAALDKNDGDVTHAAAHLDVSRRTLFRWLSVYSKHLKGVTRRGRS